MNRLRIAQAVAGAYLVGVGPLVLVTLRMST